MCVQNERTFSSYEGEENMIISLLCYFYSNNTFES